MWRSKRLDGGFRYGDPLRLWISRYSASSLVDGHFFGGFFGFCERVFVCMFTGCGYVVDISAAHAYARIRTHTHAYAHARVVGICSGLVHLHYDKMMQIDS